MSGKFAWKPDDFAVAKPQPVNDDPALDFYRTKSLALQGKLFAPKGKFRVVSVDTWKGPFEDELVGDFDTLDEAVRAARAERYAVYIYDDTGKISDFLGRD